MRDGIDKKIVECELMAGGVVVTFHDDKSYMFDSEALLENRDSLGCHLSSAAEEDEDDAASA